MKQRGRVWCVAAFLVLSIFVAGCRKQEDPWEKVPGTGPKILAAFPPIYCFAKKVAPKAKVHSLLTSTGPHDYRATSNDTIVVAGADVFFAIGLDLDEDISYKLANSAGRLDHLFKFGPMLDEKGKLLSLRKGTQPDPHVWLGIPQAEAMVTHIAEVLSKKYPKQKDEFHANAKAYNQELQKLMADGKTVLKGKTNLKLITMHDSLRYFERTFGLVFKGSILSHSAASTGAAQLAELEGICLKEKVHVIATEPQYSPKKAETLRDSLKAKKHKITIVEIDPLETANASDLQNGDYYIATMRKNIKTLAKVLPK